ncbi:energy transducer TonB [Leptothoe sp. PORK10 BA2]|uniref:energy transducer TonB n=1 Tax=Leptothoe sp. PORK10 BA2 TaxID=3110254 RepID=UPI002B1FCBDE|nr:energy transducer TonB [Leptothoe sp. PORK10 BA2]MEA5464336.1 energy transducer TonB [Leptothoe sp. PORK10 BA2]
MALSPDCIEQHKKEQAISRTSLGWGVLCAVGFYGVLIPVLSPYASSVEQLESEPIQVMVVAADGQQISEDGKIPAAPEPLEKSKDNENAAASAASESAPKKSEITEEPETPEPETPEPETPEPETPEPETPESETPKPEASEPEIPAPETPETETPEPEAPRPAIAQTSEESEPTENTEVSPASGSSDIATENESGNGSGISPASGSQGIDAGVGNAGALALVEDREGGAGDSGRGTDVNGPAIGETGETAAANRSGSRSGNRGESEGGSAASGARQFGCRGSGGCFQPDYPDAARQAGIEGAPLVHYDVDENGYVINVSLAASSGNADLDRAALAAVQQYRFTPGGQGRTRALRIDFSLEGSERHRAAQQRGEQRTIEEPSQPAAAIAPALTPRVETTTVNGPTAEPEAERAVEPAEKVPNIAGSGEENLPGTRAESVDRSGVDGAGSDGAPQTDVGIGEEPESVAIPTVKPQPAPQPVSPPVSPAPPAPGPQPTARPETPVPQSQPRLEPRPEPPGLPPQPALVPAGTESAPDA